MEGGAACWRSVQGDLGDAGQHEGGGLLRLLHLVQPEEEVQLGDRPQPLLLHLSVSRRSEVSHKTSFPVRQ